MPTPFDDVAISPSQYLMLLGDDDVSRFDDALIS